ncbi:putative ribonuclease H-like domain-containing protein [Tanacetum coccineum]
MSSNNNAKFPYLKKDEYEVWAMMMEYWITNNDMNIWKVIQNGNSLKRTGRDHDGRVIILPPTTADEHITVQRESKARTTLLYSKARSHRFLVNVLQVVLHSLVAESEPEQQVAYEDFEQIDKLGLRREGYQMAKAMFWTIGGIGKNLKLGDDEGFAPKEYGMVAGCGAACEEGAAEVYSLITGNGTDATAGEFALMGMTSKVQAYKNSLKTLEKQKRVYQQNQLGYEEKIRVLSIKLENTTNLLKHSKIIHVEAEIAKKDLQTKLDNHLAKTEKWTSSSKNLFRLIDSYMSVRTKVGLGFDKYIGESELGWDDSTFSVFTTNSKEVKGRPLFNRFAKADSLKAVPPPLSGDYTSQSDHIDLDESQISYSTKSSTSGDSNSVSNDFVSCDNSDKSSEVNTNDFASSDSSVKSSEPSQMILLLLRINFQALLNQFWDNATRLSQSNHFVPQVVLFRSGKVSIPAARPNQVLTSRPKPVSTGRPKLVPTSKQNRPPSVHAGRRNYSLVTSGWWQSTARPMAYLPTPTSSYFWTSTPFGPHGYYNQMSFLLGMDGATAVGPSAVVLGSNIEIKCYRYPRQMVDLTYLHGLNFQIHKADPIAGDEGIIDSGCSRSMTGNKERLDDFQPFKGGKMTFGGGEGRITGKGTIRTPKLDFENNRVLFTDTDCLLLSNDFELPDESMVLLRVLRKHNLYTFNLNNLALKEILACLVAKASFDEAVKWHRRMGHTEAVSTACYVLNRVLIINPHYKTPYALLTGKTPSISHFKPFGCHVTILNTSDHLGKFDGKADEGYLVGYSASNRAYRVYNMANKRVKETLNLRFLEEKANIQGIGHEWSFDLDYLTDSLGNNHDKANQSAGTQDVSSNPAGFHDDDSDSDSDELKDQEQRATSAAERLGLGFGKDAEELQKRASVKTVPPGSIPVPTSSIPVPFGDTMISPSGVPVPSGGPTDSLFDAEPKTRFSSPSDLRNNVPSPVEPRSVAQALEDLSWVDAMQAEMQQFKFQNVWILVDLPEAQGHRQEEGIDYNEVFALVARIEAIRLFISILTLTWDFRVYLMEDCLRVRLFMEALMRRRGTIDKTLFLKKHKRDIILVQVYVDDIIFGSTKKAWCDEFEALMKGEFEMSAMGELNFFLGLQVQQRPDGIFIGQDKYMQEILKKFDLESVRTATTPYEAPKPKSKNEPDNPVNVHLYISMIGSLMYLIASRPNIMFAPRELPFMLEAYSDSDYAGAKKDWKSTTGGCQFLGRRLISWQCKKQTIMATSSTKVEYVAATNCCGQAFDGPRFNHLVVNIGMLNP